MAELARPAGAPRSPRSRRVAGAAWGLALVAVMIGCRTPGTRPLRFWAFGREGEVARELMPEFERAHPGIRVQVQQVPWTAAHEKLLTAYVGRQTPDLVQLGNTWIPELVTLDALEPLEPFLAKTAALAERDYFPGIWDTNVMDGRGGRLWGIPWYVDTRVLFYRSDLLRQAGLAGPPRTWDEWRRALALLKPLLRQGGYPILLPTDEWAQPAILGIQAGATLLRDGGRHGAFRSPEFRRAAEFYVSLFLDGLAPPVTNAQVSNVYQQLDQADFGMWITGPWNLGEFRWRLPPARQHVWDTAPLPAPGPTAGAPGVSLAGGSSLAIFRASARKGDAWALVEYLSAPATQLRFYELCGDLPARLQAWEAPKLRDDPKARAFGVQLRHVASMPKVPEWESIATRLFERLDEAIRGRKPLDTVLAELDRETDRILEKRRWLLDQRGAGAR